MPATFERPLLSPEEIAVRAGEQAPQVRLPERGSVFAEREMRLRQRAPTHAMGDFLGFVAELAAAQQQVLSSYPDVPLPDEAALAAAARAGMAPLPASHWPRDPAWLAQTHRLLDSLATRVPSGPASAALARLRGAEPAWVEQQADRLLGGVMLGLDLATAPLIAAGLQTYFTHLVLATARSHAGDRITPFGLVDDTIRCPCCASLPTASISRIGGEASGYRYLHCALCSAQWHWVRIKCSRCESTKGIHYHSLRAAADDSREEPGSGAHPGKAAVEAETCDECGHYLKIVHMERDAHVDPVADDLASVTLDLLVAEAGYQRHGVNLMLLFGEPDDDEQR